MDSALNLDLLVFIDAYAGASGGRFTSRCTTSEPGLELAIANRSTNPVRPVFDQIS